LIIEPFTGQTRMPHRTRLPCGPTSIGEGALMGAAPRESPLMATARAPPYFRAQAYIDSSWNRTTSLSPRSTCAWLPSAGLHILNRLRGISPADLQALVSTAKRMAMNRMKDGEESLPPLIWRDFEEALTRNQICL
jgi:hypothetical protein